MQQQRIFEALANWSRSPGASGFINLRPQLDIHLYKTLPSTNQEAWRLIDAGATTGTVVIAQEQSAGRGQWGRRWQSAAGGLYLSMVLEPEVAIAQAPLMTCASAWGIAAGLAACGILVDIKWPNDLVSQGKKVGGILTENRLQVPAQRASGPGHVAFAVVGVGLNWTNPLPAHAASVQALLPDPATPKVNDLEDLAAIAIRGILQGYYYWHQQGDEALLQAYQQKLCHLGKEIAIGGHPGVVKGVSTEGNLIVEMNQDSCKTTRSFKSGEISLGYNV